jgi:calcium/calmodulin-dependent protein kinase I
MLLRRVYLAFNNRKVANLIDKQSGYSVVCDIFSIGAIFHLLLLGEGIFPGKGHLELLKLNK